MAKNSFYAGLIKGREMQAKRYINGYLLTLDDNTLKANGYDRASLVRQGATRTGL